MAVVAEEGIFDDDDAESKEVFSFELPFVASELDMLL